MYLELGAVMTRLNRQESRLQTRTRIRTAAATVFAAHGVRGCSVDNIAQLAGFSRGAFYSNYRTKLDLLLELLEEEQAEEIRFWQALIAGAEDWESVIPALRARFDDFAHRNDRRLLAIELQLEAMRDPEFGEAFDRSNRHVLDMSVELVRLLATKSGLALPDAEAKAAMLRALCIGLVARTTIGERRFAPADILIDFLKSNFGPTAS